jgi:hypothetical protein
MTLAVPDLERPPSRFDAPAPGPTLADVVERAWTELAVAATAVCPLCGGTLAPRYGAGHAPVAGRCASCGSELA